MNYAIRPMKIDDYPLVYELWQEAEGLNLEESDSEEAIAIYLKRNHGFCFVACDKNCILGTVLCGHDGRRGILRHLAVRRGYQKAGIGRALIERCLSALARAHIKKCNIFVLETNAEGRRFWEHLGWHALEDNFRILQADTKQG
jgi:ribosomal protein S18 acetylase RimI-like enzyme